MGRLPKPLAEAMGTPDETIAVASALGRDHPLTRAVSRQRMLAGQAITVAGAVALGVAAVLMHFRNASLILSVTAVVGSVLLVAWVAQRGVTRDRSQDLIAAGDDTDLGVVTRERRRLRSRRERERLAASLEQLLDDVQRPQRIAWSWRPLPGTECLRSAAPEVRRVIRGLRAERARAQGVALVSRLLTDGVRSPLYSGNPRRLREELSRIGYILDAPR